MERWVGRVALVTGAGSGIGEAITRALIKHGVHVVGLDINADKLQKLSQSLQQSHGRFYPREGSVTEENEVLRTFDWIKKNMKGVDILVTCAGVYFAVSLSGFKNEHFRRSYDINVLGLSICTREAIKSMKERGVDDGHIVHMCSTAGQTIMPIPEISLYSSTKHAVRVLAEGLRRELVQSKSRIRITNISPGIVNTELFQNSGLAKLAPDPQELPLLQPEDVADAVIYAIGTPPHVQVHEITIRPTGDEF